MKDNLENPTKLFKTRSSTQPLPAGETNLRNIPILSLSQVINTSGVSIFLLIGGLIGSEIAPSPALATLPVALMTVGMAIFSIPAALTMKKVGRRVGFSGAAFLASGAALLALLAVSQANFYLFCMATLLIGAKAAFGQQYRFAAIESVESPNAGKAVSVVLMGGIMAGYLGPEIARRTRDWMGVVEYSGTFLILALLYAGLGLFLLLLKNLTPPAVLGNTARRPFRQVLTQPIYLAALLSGAVAYGVMTFVMTATPLHLHLSHNYSFDQTTLIIQSHIIAMFLPSLFTGFILSRFGVLRVMASGVVVMFCCVFLAMAGYDFSHFWGALVLLGLGWNLLFVGATVLLAKSYQPEERFKAQAANDFTIFGIQAFTSLSSGTLLYFASWDILLLTTLPFLALVMVALVQLRRQIWAVLAQA
jgi:MFS family permease